jgi:hypothetical protein
MSSLFYELRVQDDQLVALTEQELVAVAGSGRHHDPPAGPVAEVSGNRATWAASKVVSSLNGLRFHPGSVDVKRTLAAVASGELDSRENPKTLGVPANNSVSERSS